MSCRSSISSAKGFTLVEVLVTMVLSAMLLGLCLSFIFPSMRAVNRTTTQSSLEQTAYLAIHRMVADCESSQPAGLGVLNTTNQVVLSVHALANVTGQQQVFADHLVVYFWDPTSQVLTRRLWPPDPPALALTLDPLLPCRPNDSELAALACTSSQQTIVARDVTAFSIGQPNPGPGLSLPLDIKLKLVRGAGAGAGDQSCELERRVCPRNNL